MSEKWYCLHTKPGKETAVLSRLQQKGITTYFPHLTRNGNVTAFFPCYLFVFVDLTAVGPNTFNWLPGAKRLVQFGDRPEVVPEGVVTAVQQGVAVYEAEIERGIVRGTAVKITDGPLAGYEGVFERYVSGRERVLVLLSLLGNAPKPLTLSTQMVTAVHVKTDCLNKNSTIL